MPSIIKAYQAVKNAADVIQIKAMPMIESKPIMMGHGSFINVLKGQLEQASLDLKNVDRSIRAYTMGEIAPEEMMLQTACTTVETKGKIELARSLVDTFNKIINMNM